MADETQNAPVAGATTENATQQKVYIYYYSDPDGATKNERCHMIKSDFPFDKPLPWHVHEEAPAEGMVDPVWNDQLNGGLGDWQENSGKAQSQILAQVQEKLGQIDTKSKELDAKAKQFDAENEKIDNAVKTVQQSQAQSTQQTLALMKTVNAQNKQMTQMIGNMQQTMALMQKSQNAILEQLNKSATPSTGEDTKPANQDNKANN